MAPSRGDNGLESATAPQGSTLSHITTVDNATLEMPALGQEPSHTLLALRAEQPQFTLRALLCGLLIGILIAFSNTYFGLQTGWISGMAMPSALIGYATFRGLNTFRQTLGSENKILGYVMGQDFSEVENVLVQTVAGAVGTMPLGCGFVGVIPALEFLLHPSETPNSTSWRSGDTVVPTSGFVMPKPHLNPSLASLAHAAASTHSDLAPGSQLRSESAMGSASGESGGFLLPTSHLILWALGICFFGVVFAVPLRKEVIVREKLRFPSGTATALVIGVLHGSRTASEDKSNSDMRKRKTIKQRAGDDEEGERLLGGASSPEPHLQQWDTHNTVHSEQGGESPEAKSQRDWKRQIRLLSISFGVSGAYTLVSYFIPQLHSIPFLGTFLAEKWLWTLNPSPAYVGQGIIMGPATTVHMLIGAILGWAVLSPLAKAKGWAPGEVRDWEKGSKGWIVWVSLAIMLADAIVSLGWLILRPTIWYTRAYLPAFLQGCREKGVTAHLAELRDPKARGYSPVHRNDDTGGNSNNGTIDASEDEDVDAPPDQLIGWKTTTAGLVLSLAFCVFAVQYSFSGLLPLGLTILALILALLLSIMGVRALGETDLNPVSGISKLTQLLFALATPPGTKNAIPINLLAGAISESGALQAGDLLQDLKTGHLLGASPKAQFYGQLIGSAVGAIVSALVYRLYTSVYTIPGGLFQVPTGYVWVFTARLVTGSGLPDKTDVFAFGAAAIWAVLTMLRIYGYSLQRAAERKGANEVGYWSSGAWTSLVPGGIAVAVGMYNTPSFTLTRTAGGLLVYYWVNWRGKAETPVIILASGLILGEGLLSIVNLGLASGHVPHL